MLDSPSEKEFAHAQGCAGTRFRVHRGRAVDYLGSSRRPAGTWLASFLEVAGTEPGPGHTAPAHLAVGIGQDGGSHTELTGRGLPQHRDGHQRVPWWHGLECRLDDARTQDFIAALDDPATQVRVKAERAFNARLQGGCQVPIAGHALLDHDQLWLRGLVGEPDGSRIVAGEIRGPAAEAETLGAALAEELLERGADTILRRLLATS